MLAFILVAVVCGFVIAAGLRANALTIVVGDRAPSSFASVNAPGAVLGPVLTLREDGLAEIKVVPLTRTPDVTSGSVVQPAQDVATSSHHATAAIARPSKGATHGSTTHPATSVVKGAVGHVSGVTSPSKGKPSAGGITVPTVPKPAVGSGSVSVPVAEPDSGNHQSRGRGHHFGRGSHVQQDRWTSDDRGNDAKQRGRGAQARADQASADDKRGHGRGHDKQDQDQGHAKGKGDHGGKHGNRSHGGR